MSIDKKAICYALNKYIFQNIWNMSASESRVNIKPFLVNNSRSCTGYCLIGNHSLPLPNFTEAFYVYRFTYENSHGALNLTRNKWYDTVELCNDNDILVHTYTNNGLTFSKKNCYVYVEENSNAINLAISKRAVNRISPNNKNIYVTLYVDSDEVGEVTIYSYDGGNSNQITHRLDRATKEDKLYEDRHVIYIDGYYYSPSVARAKFSSDSLVDVIIDKDIIGAFDVPVVEDPHTFHSDRDNLYKEIVHIPKEMNPENYVITFNTCTMYVQDDSEKGTYLHYTSDKTTCQLTHNDLSVPTHIINAHKDYLDTTTVSLHVKVRRHSKNNRLLRNSNYVDLLYVTQDDDQIIKHLEGTIDETLHFWKASELEKHPYTKMMFEVPKVITEENMDLYIDALGYYHVVSLLSHRVFTTTVTDKTTRTLSYPKPYIWSNREIYPVIYVKGLKIPNDYVKYINTPDNRISIKLHDDVVINTGDKITVYMFPKGNDTVEYFSPNMDQPSIVLNNDDLSMYLEVNHSIDINSMYDSTNIAYKEVSLDDYDGIISVMDNGDGTSTYTFGSSLFGDTFVFMYDTYTKEFKKDLSDDIDQTKNFIVDLYHYLDNEDTYIPLLNIKDMCVYLNGKYLVEGIDYKYVQVDAFDGSITKTQVCVQNMSYAKDEGTNIIEVIASTIKTIDADYGFVLSDMASEDIDVDLWFDGLSTLHINGKYEPDVTCTGVGMLLPKDKYPDGSIFELKTAMPVVVKELLHPHDGTKDISYIEAIEAYLNKHLVPKDQDVILKGSHRIMSSYTNFLINGILNDEIHISYDPDINRIQSQLDRFSYLRQYDNIFNEDSINLRFVDIYPTYRDLTVADPQKAKVIYMLTELILPEDPYTSGVVQNESI